MTQIDNSDSTYIEAISYYIGGEWENAKPLFHELSEKYEKSSYVRFILGDIYYSLGGLDTAIKWYQDAIFLNAKFGIAYYKLGVCFYRKGHLNRALDAFNMVEQTGQNHAMARYHAGLIHLYLGNDEKASIAFERFKEGSPDSLIANLYLAQLKLKSKDYHAALQPLEELVEQTPQFAEVHYMLGTVYYGLHNNAKAVQCFRRALQLNPEDERSKAKLTLLTDIQFT